MTVEKRNPTKYDEHEHVAKKPIVRWTTGGHLAEAARRSMSDDASVAERGGD